MTILPAGGVRQSAAAGIALYAGAVFVLAIMDALIKWASERYPTAQIVFFRSTVGMFPVIVLLANARGLAPLRTRRLGLHLLRGVIAAVATSSFFYAFSALPLAEVYAIGFAAPVFVTAMSVPLLGETVGIRRWAAVIIGFAGTLLMIVPLAAGGGGFATVGLVTALVGTIGYALSLVLMRRLGSSETNVAMVFYGGVVTIAIAGVALFLGDLAPWLGWVAPDGRGWALLVAIGLLGGTGGLMMAQAFRVATPSILVPFEYTGLVWGVMIGWVFWTEVPQAWVWAGSVLVVGSGLYILHRETVVRGRPVAAGPADAGSHRRSGVRGG